MEDIKLTEIQKKILEKALWVYGHYGSDMSYFGYSTLMDIGTKKELQPEMKVLRGLGLLTYARGLMNEDGEVCGSGYSIPYGKFDETKQLLEETT